LLIVYAVAFIGSLFVSQTVNTIWYSSINTPITPPKWVFPLVWNILYLFIAISLYLAWTAKIKSKKYDRQNKIKIAIVFGLNLLFNIFWSYLFFTVQSPILSFSELLVLEFSIFVMFYMTYKIKKSAAYFLIPYGAWVAFAGVLNYIIAFR
jgi:tryptophan-rich sensory protein